MIFIFIIISVIFISTLILIFGRSRNIQKKDTAGSSFEICFSLGIFISFFLPWVTFTTDNIGLGVFGLDTRNLAELSWAKLVKLAWNIYDFANQFQKQNSDQQAQLIGFTLLVSLPLIMATINIFLLIAGRVRGWSFYTGLISLGWTAVCLYGSHEAHGLISFGVGFVIGTLFAICLMLFSLIFMLINPRQHLSFVLGHFSLVIFGIILSILGILLKAMGISTSASSNIPIIICGITTLILTFVCDYYLFMYLTRQKEGLTSQEGQSLRQIESDHDRAETILDQHWMYCSKCGTKCKDYLKFCPRCGFGLHPEREESSSEYSSYAPPVETPDQPEYIPLKENTKSIGSTIPVIDNQIRPVVTKTGGAIHVENKVHPTIESSPEPQVKESPKVVEQKIPASPSAATGNKWRLWVLIAFAVLLVGAFPAYLFWYKPYATDRDAPRYFTFTNLNLRSSKIADVKHNLLELLPYGTELITYSIDTDWANVKVGGLKGYVASNLILSKADFELLNNVWGNTDAKECINTAKCRLAVLDYYKRFNMSGGTEWQIFTAGKESRINNMYYRRIYNPNSKFTDFTFIVKNNRTKERELVIYSFDDETEKPIYRTARRLSSSESGYIKSITSSNGWIDILFTDGGWIQISVSR